MSDELRKRALEELERAISEYEDDIEQLKAENAKLRELVRDMWHEGAFEAGACYVEEVNRLEERTHELGIEVDE